jgi:chromate reductase
VRVLAISGSLREGSFSIALARAARELAPEGVELELASLADVPLYNADADGERSPEAVRELRTRITEADAVLFITPEYNGSVSGVLKNAVDWASRPAGAAALTGKTVAVAGVTTGSYGAVWAQADLRRILGIAGARVLDADLPVAKADTKFDSSGRLIDPAVTERLRSHLEALVALADPGDPQRLLLAA